MLKRYLIAIDSDATLCRSDGTISKRTINVIRKLVKNNNVVVICTARPRYHASKISKTANASNYYISSNGAEIFDDNNNKVIYGKYVNVLDVEKIFKKTLQEDVRAIFACDNTEYVTKFTRNKSQILVDSNNYEILKSKNIKQIMIIGNQIGKINALKKYASSCKRLSVIDSSNKNNDEIWFSIVSKYVSKGEAVLFLSNYLKIDFQNIIAIGNDKNDISMLNIAGLSVAIGNASNEVKKIADINIESNDDDGVALFLEKLFR